MTTSLPHTHVHMHRHILSRSSVGVIWRWPSGSFFSICVGLTHFSPRPHPTVPFPKHMCGGRGISELAPRGTCWHRLQIWHWTHDFLSVCVPHHMPSSILAPRIFTFAMWQNTSTASPSPAPSQGCLRYKYDYQTKYICKDLFLLMQNMCVYNMYLPSIDFHLASHSLVNLPLSIHLYFVSFYWPALHLSTWLGGQTKILPSKGRIG